MEYFEIHSFFIGFAGGFITKIFAMRAFLSLHEA